MRSSPFISRVDGNLGTVVVVNEEEDDDDDFCLFIDRSFVECCGLGYNLGGTSSSSLCLLFDALFDVLLLLLLLN